MPQLLELVGTHFQKLLQTGAHVVVTVVVILDPILQGIRDVNILVEWRFEVTGNIVIRARRPASEIIEPSQAGLREGQIRFDARRRILRFAQLVHFIFAEVIAFFRPPRGGQGNCQQQNRSHQGAHTAITALPWGSPDSGRFAEGSNLCQYGGSPRETARGEPRPAPAPIPAPHSPGGRGRSNSRSAPNL